MLKARGAGSFESPCMSDELLSGTAAPTTTEPFNKLQFAAALFHNLYLLFLVCMYLFL